MEKEAPYSTAILSIYATFPIRSIARRQKRTWYEEGKEKVGSWYEKAMTKYSIRLIYNGIKQGKGGKFVMFL